MKYSIITPVYNREDCIGRCIESVIKQINLCGGADKIEVEHIIVNDGSRDDTGRICNNYVRRNEHLRYIELTENKGTNAARNVAIKAASGDFIIILDSDDYFVDDAISIIDRVVKSNPQYRYYMFAPDDISYREIGVAEETSKEFHYTDFLSGRISGDFIHCIEGDVMKRHLFDENVRIYEGIFFLSFYKEVQKMLFINHIVTIRERGRSDSVSFDVIRTRRVFIERRLSAQELLLSRFGNDMLINGFYDRLSNLYTSLFENYLLLGRYSQISDLDYLYDKQFHITLPHTLKYQLFRLIKCLRLGFVSRMFLYVYLYTKYKVFKKKIR